MGALEEAATRIADRAGSSQENISNKVFIIFFVGAVLTMGSRTVRSVNGITPITKSQRAATSTPDDATRYRGVHTERTPL